MAPKRRTQSSRPVPANQQSKLSFSNKVTKAGAKQQSKGTKQDPALVEDIVRTDIKAEAEPDVAEPTTAEKAIEEQVEQEASTLDVAQDPLEDGAVKTEDVLGGRAEQSDVGAIGGKASGWVADEVERARKTTDTQIKRYWREKEQERLAPRVHQEDLTLYEKVLREWDTSGKYGVSVASICYIGCMLTKSTAMHRHRTSQAMEACEHARSPPSDRDPRSFAQGDGCRRHKSAASACGRADEFTICG